MWVGMPVSLTTSKFRSKATQTTIANTASIHVGEASLAKHVGLGALPDHDVAGAEVRDVQLRRDRAQQRGRRGVLEEVHLLERLRTVYAQHKPAEWRSRAYLRAEAAGDEKARKRAEEREREKWARKVIRFITNAELPFGKEVIGNG